MSNAKKLEVERIATGEYLWRFKSGNGIQVSWSGETYKSLASCLNGARVGSPAVEVVPDSNLIRYWEYDNSTSEYVLLEGRYEFINSFEDEYGRQKLPAEPALQSQIIRADPTMSWAFGVGLKRDGYHLTAADGTVWHQRHPDQPVCLQPDCPIKMEQPPPYTVQVTVDPPPDSVAATGRITEQTL